MAGYGLDTFSASGATTGKLVNRWRTPFDWTRETPKALLAKENALAFLAIVPLTLFVFVRASKRTLIRIMVPLLLASTLYLFSRSLVIGLPGKTTVAMELMNNPYLSATSAERLATTLYTWGRYFCLLIVPHPLTHDYYPKHISLLDVGDVRFIGSLLAVLLMAGFALAKIRTRSVPAFALAFFFLSFSPQSNLFINVGTFMNERFMFAPSLGFALLVAWGVGEACQRFPVLAQRRAVPLALILILSAYSWKTFTRNFAWRDTYTVFMTDVLVSTNSAHSNLGAGKALVQSVTAETPLSEKKRRLERAESYLRKALEIHPRYIDGWVWLGYVQRERGSYREARESLENALRLDRGNTEAIQYLAYDACTFLVQGKAEQSIECFETLTQYVPWNEDFFFLLAKAYEMAGRAEKSAVILEGFAKDHPGDRRPYDRLSELYKRLGDRDRARAYSEKADLLSPASASAPK